jgi:large subunit ribosomal protein L10
LPPNGEGKWKERKSASSLTSFNEVLNDTGVVVVAHYAGLSVADMTAFGRKCAKPAARSKSRKTAL